MPNVSLCTIPSGVQGGSFSRASSDFEINSTGLQNGNVFPHNIYLESDNDHIGIN